MAPDPWYRPDPALREEIRRRILAPTSERPQPAAAAAPSRSFTMVPNDVRDLILHSHMRMMDFGVLMHFVFEFGRYSHRRITYLDVTVQDLVEALGLSNHTVCASLDRLVRVHRVLTREVIRNRAGHTITTRYTLHLESFRRADEARKPECSIAGPECSA